MRVYLRHPAPEDQATFLAAVKASQALHRPWVSPPATPLQFRSYAGRMQEPPNCAFLVCRRGSDEIASAFRSLKLHRLEANIQPANAASIALVRACGFSKEGYSPRYLKIGGRWRDHERWAILAS